jgi:hypothetical protein
MNILFTEMFPGHGYQCALHHSVLTDEYVEKTSESLLQALGKSLTELALQVDCYVEENMCQ